MMDWKQNIKEAYDRISSHIHKTPVLTSSYINSLCGAELFFKCENFQKGGSYKLRGALNATLELSDEDRAKGIATHSSGNFAQAVSISANITNAQAHIVMPENAPVIKKQATQDYGAKVYFCESTLKAREETLEKVTTETGASRLHPSNDIPVIIGQGTCAYELIDQVEDLDFIVAPVGGGGVAAGSILTTTHFAPTIRVVGAEPSNADDAYRSLQQGEIQPSVNVNTIADGLRTQLGDNNFPIIRDGIHSIILVTEEEIIEAMQIVWNRMKIIIEPSSATTLAVVLKSKDLFQGKKVGLIITGGNVDLTKLPF